MSIQIAPLTGAALRAALPDLARLRIGVFREWPYLYDGSDDYERDYLARFSESDGSIVVAAMDANRVIGAATGTPLGGHAEDFAQPFVSRGADLSRIFYFGESVLLRSYRGRGIGHAFFDLREAHARSLGGFAEVTFCSVVRPLDHPLRPRDYRDVEGLWRKRGYRPVEGLVGSFKWLDIGEEQETAKPMQYWMKDL